MRIGVIGGGVTGSATAGAFRGHCDEVRVYDTDPARRTVTNPYYAVKSDIVFVCLPETAVEAFFDDVAGGDANKVWKEANFVLRSTVPVGTTRRLAEKYGLVNLCHSPEFLTERTALEDAANPRLLVIGSDKTYGIETPLIANPVALHNLYVQRWPNTPLWHLTTKGSELVKLATNAFFATKVSFWNEVESYCHATGVDYETVRAACVAEGRVGDLHTHVPGPDGRRGFGGKCLYKDTLQLIGCMKEWSGAGVVPAILETIIKRNDNIDRPEGP